MVRQDFWRSALIARVREILLAGSFGVMSDQDT
jgi:hypothetical protein